MQAAVCVCTWACVMRILRCWSVLSCLGGFNQPQQNTVLHSIRVQFVWLKRGVVVLGGDIWECFTGSGDMLCKASGVPLFWMYEKGGLASLHVGCCGSRLPKTCAMLAPSSMHFRPMHFSLWSNAAVRCSAVPRLRVYSVCHNPNTELLCIQLLAVQWETASKWHSRSGRPCCRRMGCLISQYTESRRRLHTKLRAVLACT